MKLEYGLFISQPGVDTSLKWVGREDGQSDAEYHDAAQQAGINEIRAMSEIGVRVEVTVVPYIPIIDQDDNMADAPQMS